MKFLAPASIALLLLTSCDQHGGASSPAPVRISFLNSSNALNSTIRFLRTRGSPEDGLRAFQRAVESYNSVPLAFDLSRLPQAHDGTYAFQSTTQLLAALPTKFRDIPHAWEFNCYDTLILLTGGQLRSGLGPDDLFGVSLSPQIATNGQLQYAPAVTAREAYTFSMPAWYLAASHDFIPSSMHNSRISLTAAFYSFNVLPASTTLENLASKVFETLRTNWTRQAVVFPQKSDAVLVHEVQLDIRTCITMHAGLLLPQNAGYIYLEKDSGRGPFVRLDVPAKRDLLQWLSAKYSRHETGGSSRFFATFNDRSIEELSVGE